MTVAAVDIGGTRLKLGIVDERGDLLDTAIAPTLPESPGLIDRVGDLIATVVERHRPAAIGVATAGIVDADRGTIIGGSSNLPGWPGTDVAGVLGDRFGLPVAVDNDVNAAALGEWAFGAGRGSRVMLAVMVGTGMGAGLVLDGRVYHGGHFGGMDISYEAVPNVPVGYYPNPYSAECSIGIAGLRYLLREAEAQGRPSLLQSDSFRIGDLYLAAGQGDLLAVELQARMVEALITVLTNLFYVIDPDRLLLGGGAIEAAGDGLLATLERGIRDRLTDNRQPWLDLRPFQLGEMAGVYGAAALARQRIS